LFLSSSKPFTPLTLGLNMHPTSTLTPTRSIWLSYSLALRYKNQWNVFAVDIKVLPITGKPFPENMNHLCGLCNKQNRPFSATWGTGKTNTDWDVGAARIANALASTVSNCFLFFLEGVSLSPPYAQACFLGEDLIVWLFLAQDI